MNVLIIDALLGLLFVAGIAAITLQGAQTHGSISVVSRQMLAYDLANIEMRGVKVSPADIPQEVCVEINSAVQVEQMGNCAKKLRNEAVVEFLELVDNGAARVSRITVNYS